MQPNPESVMRRENLILLICLIALIHSLAIAQSSRGPFDEIIGKSIKSDNIFLLWQEEFQDSGWRSFQKVFNYELTSSEDGNFSDIPAVHDPRPVGGNRHMVVTTGKYVVSPYDYVIAAWEGENRTIELMIPHFDSTDVMWNTHTAFTVEGPVVATDGNNERGRIFVESGDFTGNGLDEFALVYHGADSTIHVEVYDVDEAFSPRLVASINDETLLPTPPEFAQIAVAAGDLNGNGRDEIILTSVEQIGTQSWAWRIYMKVYELSASNTLEERVREIVYLNDPNELNISGMDIAVETGNFRDVGKNELVFAVTFSTNAFEDDTFIYLLEADEALDTLFFDSEKRISMQKSVNDRGIIGLASGDLNNDGRDEFVFALSGSFDVYTVDEMLDPVRRSGGSLPAAGRTRQSYDFVAISDIDQSERSEVIVVGNFFDQNNSEQWFELMAFAFHDSQNGILNNRETKAWRTMDQPAEISDGSSWRRHAIAVGNFNGHEFTLGEPEYYIEQEVPQPLVILNAPPVHFDVFDGTIYDTNQCFEGVDCGFRTTYFVSGSETNTIETEVRADYNFSIGVGLSGTVETAPMGIGGSVAFETYLDGKFGSNFGQTDMESSTISISEQVAAVVDDMIYATIIDYDVWEYPVYYGSERSPRKITIAVEPRTVRSRWFTSKSWMASNHIPVHEVGNILSYPSYEELTDNPNIGEGGSFKSSTYPVAALTDNQWVLDISKIRESSLDTTTKQGMDFRFLAGIRVQRDRTFTEMSTHTTSVQEGLMLTVDLKGIDRSLGENDYAVTPYAYWAKNGALVVDYAVEVDRSGPGGTPTWWEVKYGEHPDPAFVLPWRYDPEKGFGISEEAKRYQTKDVFFDIDDPVPGDTLTITARVRNFSLVDSPPVTVHFYVGDPDDGGTPIVGVDAETSVTTDGGIPSQRYRDAETRWLVPTGLPRFPRIYAVLNQDNEFTEIHVNNNKGFNILGQGVVDLPTGSWAERTIPTGYKLHQSYPNPFNPSTTIPYSLPENTNVLLEVYNILGQRVAVLVDADQQAGNHEALFDATYFASGIYLYRITAGSFTASKRMLLLK